jgi:hypothetical protein
MRRLSVIAAWPILLACLVLSGSLSFSQPAPFQPVLSAAGCYRLRLSAWSPPFRTPEEAAVFTPPEWLRLEETPRKFGDGGFSTIRTASYVVSPIQSKVGQSVQKHFRVGSWSLAGTNHILLEWTTGFVWLKIYLRNEGGELKGVLQTFSDAEGSIMPKCEVTAIRVPCDG